MLDRYFLLFLNPSTCSRDYTCHVHSGNHHTIFWEHPRLQISPTLTVPTAHTFLSQVQTMERLPLLFLLLLTALSSTLASTVSSSNLDDPLIRQVVSDGEDHLLNAEHHFTTFKSKFGKNYATQEEHDYRFSVFKANLLRAKKHQMMDPTAAHGVTKFSDLTPKEFRRQLLGLKRRLRLPTDANKAPILPTGDLPTNFDWRDHGAVTNVKDQVS